MKIQKIQGLIAAPFTAMDVEGKLNLSLVKDYYAFLKRNDIKGAFINGSTGEGVSLTLDEKKLHAEAWAAATKDDDEFKVITLVGGTCLADCIDLATHAQAQGLYATAFTAPFYFKPNVNALAEVCKIVADAIPGMPFYYYHIPVLTGVNVAMYDLLNAINGKIENFAGVKYTHEDFMDFLSCLSLENGKYDMLWGRDENMLSALILGSKGAVGSTYNYAAPLYNNLIAAYENNDFELARKLQQQSIDMIRLLGKYGGIATGKAFMKLIGLDCGEFRLPVKNMTKERFELFKSDVDGVGFQSFKSV